MSRRSFYHSVSVDVDIDSSVLEENGYHHEEDCEKRDEEAEVQEQLIRDNRQRLADWHDLKHGLGRWDSCTYEPCNLLTDSFKNI